MPEFIADTYGTVAGKEWDDLSPFVQGYLECVLFTETAGSVSMVNWNDPEVQNDLHEGSLDGDIPGDSGFSDIYPGSLETAIRECEDFQREAGDLLAQAYQQVLPEHTFGDGTLPSSYTPARDYDEAAAGRDFWFTRNGHGVGFWDRDLPGDISDKLTDIAHKFGGRDASFGDAANGSESPTGYGWVFIE